MSWKSPDEGIGIFIIFDLSAFTAFLSISEHLHRVRKTRAKSQSGP